MSVLECTFVSVIVGHRCSEFKWREKKTSDWAQTRDLCSFGEFQPSTTIFQYIRQFETEDCGQWLKFCIRVWVLSLSPVAGPFCPVAFPLSSGVLQQLTLCMHLVLNTFVLSTNWKCIHFKSWTELHAGYLLLLWQHQVVHLSSATANQALPTLSKLLCVLVPSWHVSVPSVLKSPAGTWLGEGTAYVNQWHERT